MKDKRIKAGQPCFVLHYEPFRINKNGEPVKEITERTIAKVGRKYIYTDSGDKFCINSMCGRYYSYYWLFMTKAEMDEFFERIELKKKIERFNYRDGEKNLKTEDLRAICAILDKYSAKAEQ